MTIPTAALIGLAIAAASACGLAGVVAWCGPVDAPGARTSHGRPTPTSGGLATAAGAALGVVVFVLLAHIHGHDLGQVTATLMLAGGLGLVGALDDLFDVGARAKLAAQLLAALVFSVFVDRIEVLPLGFGVALPLGPAIGALGTTLWIVVATNAVNFMDGANGVAPGAQATVLAALACAAFQAGLTRVGGAALAGAAACAGFLPWNLGGRLFQGDAGALFASFLFAGLAVVAAHGGGGAGQGAVFLYFAPLALFPFLTDVLLTLAVRTGRGEPMFEAHRDHLYQLWLKRDPTRLHVALAARTGAIMAAYAAAALLLQHVSSDLQPLLFALAVVVTAASWAAMRRRLAR